MSLTPHGQYLLERARELLALNDAIWNTFRAPQLHGTVRLGTPDDYALRYLPGVLKRFADTHPAVEVDVTCASSTECVERLQAGELDLTLCSEGHEPPRWPADELWRGPLRWITVGAALAAPARPAAAGAGRRQLLLAARGVAGAGRDRAGAIASPTPRRRWPARPRRCWPGWR